MQDILLVAMTAVVMLSPVPASADSRQVRIVNETGYGIEFIGVNAPGDDDWSNNRIISVIRNGTSAQVSLTGDGTTCRRDIRIGLTGNIAPTLLKDVDLCSLRALTLHYSRKTGELSYERR
jgi:hypothetical protein